MQTTPLTYAAELEQAIAYTAADERAWEAATPYVLSGEVRYTEARDAVDNEMASEFGPECGALYADYQNDIFNIEQAYDVIRYVLFH